MSLQVTRLLRDTHRDRDGADTLEDMRVVGLSVDTMYYYQRRSVIPYMGRLCALVPLGGAQPRFRILRHDIHKSSFLGLLALAETVA